MLGIRPAQLRFTSACLHQDRRLPEGNWPSSISPEAMTRSSRGRNPANLAGVDPFAATNVGVPVDVLDWRQPRNCKRKLP